MDEYGDMEVLELAEPAFDPMPDPVLEAARTGKQPWHGYRAYLYDFEYVSIDGNQPEPVCLVYADMESGEYHRIWQDELLQMKNCPFDTSAKSIAVSFYYPAEGSCFEVLNWPHPVNVVDLYAEFRCVTNGRRLPMRSSLLGAMIFYGIPSMAGSMKDTMRDLILGGGPWNEDEREAILRYCQQDVKCLGQLVDAMKQDIDLKAAFYRGRYCTSVAKMEAAGVPIDLDYFQRIQSEWPNLMTKLVEEANEHYHCFEGMQFKQKKFEAFLEDRNIRWPRTPSGRLDLKDETFREKSQRYPELEKLRELRSTLSQTRNLAITVGEDGRNRVMLSPYGTKTSRHNPSTNKFAFGPAKWVRFLMKPGPGKAIAYLDYSQQEFLIGAALSGDENMLEAYYADDPYLKFGQQAGQVPDDATKETHPKEREMFKTCSLGVLFRMTGEGMAERLGIPKEAGRQLLSLHKSVYPTYWKWSHDLVQNSILRQEMQTVLGWKMFVQPRQKNDDRNLQRTLANFPLQGNGAEMLRVAIIKAHEKNVRVLCPVHDAIMIESNLEDINEAVALTTEAMIEASKIVLDGRGAKVEAEIIRYPDRYFDERGEEMWNTITRLLDDIQ